MCIFSKLSSDKLGAAKHVAPLVVSAEFKIAVVLLEHVVEVIGLHDHVVEFKE